MSSIPIELFSNFIHSPSIWAQSGTDPTSGGRDCAKMTSLIGQAQKVSQKQLDSWVADGRRENETGE